MGTGSGQAPLAAPAVAADAYDREYYLHGCMGADEWRSSDGARVSGLYAGSLIRAGLQPGERVLDLGTGRGDLLPAAIELATTTLERAGNPPGARAELADARRAPVDDAAFDLVTMLDLVEHLSPAELTTSLGQAMRACAPAAGYLSIRRRTLASTSSPIDCNAGRGDGGGATGRRTRAATTSARCTSTSRRLAH